MIKTEAQYRYTYEILRLLLNAQYMYIHKQVQQLWVLNIISNQHLSIVYSKDEANGFTCYFISSECIAGMFVTNNIMVEEIK